MKRALLLLFAVIVISFFSITSSAHSGRTDSAGGHYDRDSGDYHYHHGYSAHNHYDMDGDGIKEYCPYNDDEENEHGEAQILKPRKTTKTTTNTVKKTKQSKSDSTEFDITRYIGALLGAAFISFFASSCVFGLIVRFFEKYMTEKSNSRVFVILWVAITIIISIIIYSE